MKRILNIIILSILISIFTGIESHAQTFVSRQGYEFPANEISLSYGYITVPHIAYAFGGIFGTAFSLGLAKVSEINSTGAVALDYQRYVCRSVAVGAVLAYENCAIRFDSSDGEGGTIEGERQNSSIISIMPAAKFQWFNCRNVGMYSKLAAGAMMSISKDSSSVGFAFQLSPVCIDFGGCACRGFLEAGLGSQGLVQAGIRYCF